MGARMTENKDLANEIPVLNEKIIKLESKIDLYKVKYDDMERLNKTLKTMLDTQTSYKSQIKNLNQTIRDLEIELASKSYGLTEPSLIPTRAKISQYNLEIEHLKRLLDAERESNKKLHSLVVDTNNMSGFIFKNRLKEMQEELAYKDKHNQELSAALAETAEILDQAGACIEELRGALKTQESIKQTPTEQSNPDSNEEISMGQAFAGAALLTTISTLLKDFKAKAKPAQETVTVKEEQKVEITV